MVDNLANLTLLLSCVALLQEGSDCAASESFRGVRRCAEKGLYKKLAKSSSAARIYLLHSHLSGKAPAGLIPQQKK